MNILTNFEHLATQVIFPSNKDTVLRSCELYDILKSTHNQEVRYLLSDHAEQFADMSRIVR